MKFSLDQEQRLLLDSVESFLKRMAGPARSRELKASDSVDGELAAAMHQQGYLDVADAAGPGTVAAALVVEASARQLVEFNVGARALVAPALTGDAPNLLAVCREGSTVPIRFAAHAEAIIVVGEHEARLVALGAGDAIPVKSIFGYRYATVTPASGGSFGTGSGRTAVRRWRMSLAAEMVGSMRAARDLTLRYVAEREQFGRPIGSFQAIQHRLSDVHISVEGARWLMLSAAWDDTDERVAAAAGYAAQTALTVVREMHQFSGAIGLTDEYDLQLWTLKLEALRNELGGSREHFAALAHERWPVHA